jgi:ubiquinone/menaquinone biosynthesis C-methylase UbiE
MSASSLPVRVVLALLVSFVVQTADQKRDADDAAKLIEVLNLRPGAVVADIGAGSGALEPFISRAIGAAGRLYATDISADRLADIRKVVASASLSNVTVVQGGEAETKLPPDCCDAIFMRLVYHHFGDPAAMNASLLHSLKSGGRLAVLDFRPDSGVTAAPGKRAEGKSHGVMPATVIDELTAAGFLDVHDVPWPTTPTFAVLGKRAASSKDSAEASSWRRSSGSSETAARRP